MNYIVPFLLFALGTVIIIKCSDFFLEGAIWISKTLHVPEIIIGATIVSLCTTLPEMTVSLTSVFAGDGDMALGNAIGSVAFNTGIILALSILILRPAVDSGKTSRANAYLLVFSLAFVSLSAAFTGELGRTTGFILLACLVFFFAGNVFSARRNIIVVKNSGQDEKVQGKTTVFKLLFLIFGSAGIIFGARLMVNYGVEIASMLGVPTRVIGITITAAGTSLPELFTTITSIAKKRPNIAVGNVLGANLLNVLMVVGASTAVSPIATDRMWTFFYIPVVLLITLIGFYPLFLKRRRYPLISGVLILAVYVIYITVAIANS